MPNTCARLKATATRLIQKYGSVLTFTRVTGTVRDPETRQQTQTTETYTAYCVKSDYDQSDIDGSTIQRDDIRLIAEDGNYALGDTVNIGGIVHTILNVNRTKPGDESLKFELQVRA